MADDSAGGPLAGYLWQVDLGLVRLLRMDPDQVLTLEVHDDLGVVTGDNAIQVLEQDKHSLNSGSLTAKTPCFWKALMLWAGKWSRGELPYVPTLRLATNRRVAAELKTLTETSTPRDNETAKAIDKRLCEVAEEGASKTLRNLHQDWLQMKEKDRVLLLQQIQLLEESALREMSTRLEKELSISGVPDSLLNEFRHGLEGWYRDVVRSRLTHGGMRIRASEQKARQAELWRRYGQQEVVFLSGADIDAASLVTEGERQKVYFRQLELVGASVDQKLMAVEFLHQTQRERDRLLKHVLGREEIQVHENEVQNQWRVVRATEPSIDDAAAQGRHILERCLCGSSTIRRSPAPTFFHLGTLQILADGPQMPPRVGWHPDYEQLICAEDEEANPGSES